VVIREKITAVTIMKMNMIKTGLTPAMAIMEKSKVTAKTMTRTTNMGNDLIPAMEKKRKRMRQNGAVVRVSMDADKIRIGITTRVTIKITIVVIIRILIRDITVAITGIRAVPIGAETIMKGGPATRVIPAIKDGPAIKEDRAIKEDPVIRDGQEIRVIQAIRVILATRVIPGIKEGPDIRAGLVIKVIPTIKGGPAIRAGVVRLEEDSPVWTATSDAASPAREVVPIMKKEALMDMTKEEVGVTQIPPPVEVTSRVIQVDSSPAAADAQVMAAGPEATAASRAEDKRLQIRQIGSAGPICFITAY
jgi:hypothetical protein